MSAYSSTQVTVMKHEFQRPAKKYQSKWLKKHSIRLYSSAAYNQNYEENEKSAVAGC